MSKFKLEELHTEKISKFNYEMSWSALRVPGGNQVDGLPQARHTETIAKRARVRPRTQVLTTMKIKFEVIFWSTSAPLSDMIVLDNVLKIWIELMKLRNYDAMEKFYWGQVFSKVEISVEISKFSKISKNSKSFEGEAPALRVIRAGTRLTVHRSLPSTEFIWNFDLFEHVFRWQNHHHMKMCHMENVLYVLKFHFGWVWAPDDNVNEIYIWGQ